MSKQKGFQLADVINQPEFQRLVLGEYRGAYSLGVGTLRGGSKQALVLEVEMKDLSGFPNQVSYQDQTIPLIVYDSFRIPRAQSRKSLS